MTVVSKSPFFFNETSGIDLQTSGKIMEGRLQRDLENKLEEFFEIEKSVHRIVCSIEEIHSNMDKSESKKTCNFFLFSYFNKRTPLRDIYMTSMIFSFISTKIFLFLISPYVHIINYFFSILITILIF